MFLEKLHPILNPIGIYSGVHIKEVLASAKTLMNRHVGLCVHEATGKIR